MFDRVLNTPLGFIVFHQKQTSWATLNKSTNISHSLNVKVRISVFFLPIFLIVRTIFSVLFNASNACKVDKSKSQYYRGSRPIHSVTNQSLCSQLFRRLISHRTKTVFFQNITHNQSGFKAHLSSSFCIFLVAVKGLKGFDIR